LLALLKDHLNLFWLIARQENDHCKALSAFNCSSRLVAAIQQLQPTNPKKQPNFKTQPKKQTPRKKPIGKATTTIN
jgi:hypothetical protein